MSQVAEVLGIHIPHASTHMKALREVGWIHRLEDGGARGAMHSITPDGIDALSMDAKVRFTRLHEPGKMQEGAVLVVMVEGPDLVLGYTLAEVPGLLPIPMLPRVIMNGTGASSSGNEGGPLGVGDPRSTACPDARPHDP